MTQKCKGEGCLGLDVLARLASNHKNQRSRLLCSSQLWCLPIQSGGVSGFLFDFVLMGRWRFPPQHAVIRSHATQRSAPLPQERGAGPHPTTSIIPQHKKRKPPTMEVSEGEEIPAAAAAGASTGSGSAEQAAGGGGGAEAPPELVGGAKMKSGRKSGGSGGAPRGHRGASNRERDEDRVPVAHRNFYDGKNEKMHYMYYEVHVVYT